MVSYELDPILDLMGLTQLDLGILVQERRVLDSLILGPEVRISKPDETKKAMGLDGICPPLHSCLFLDMKGMTHAILEVLVGGIVQIAITIFVDDDNDNGWNGVSVLGDALSKKRAKISYTDAFPPGASQDWLGSVLDSLEPNTDRHLNGFTLRNKAAGHYQFGGIIVEGESIVEALILDVAKVEITEIKTVGLKLMFGFDSNDGIHTTEPNEVELACRKSNRHGRTMTEWLFPWKAQIAEEAYCEEAYLIKQQHFSFCLEDWEVATEQFPFLCLEDKADFQADGINSDFAIKCGGPQITSTDGIVFEMDNGTLGSATYSTNRWVVSNVGLFTGSSRLEDGFAETPMYDRHKHVQEVGNSSITSAVSYVLLGLNLHTNVSLGRKGFTTIYDRGKGIMCGFTMIVLHLLGDVQFDMVESAHQGMGKFDGFQLDNAQECVGNPRRKETQSLSAILSTYLVSQYVTIKVIEGLNIIDADAGPNMTTIQFIPSSILLLWNENSNLGSLYEIGKVNGDTSDSCMENTIPLSLKAFTSLHVYFYSHDLEDKVNFKGMVLIGICTQRFLNNSQGLSRSILEGPNVPRPNNCRQEIVNWREG